MCQNGRLGKARCCKKKLCYFLTYLMIDLIILAIVSITKILSAIVKRKIEQPLIFGYKKN